MLALGLAALFWPTLGIFCFLSALLWYLSERPDQIDVLRTAKRYLIACLAISIGFFLLGLIHNLFDFLVTGVILTWTAPAGLVAGWIIGHWVVLAWRLIRRQRPEE